MNINKKDSGWILCPSTTFPGKFYYFNVLNGETAWSLGDADRRLIRKNGDIPKAAENHHHPEPSSLPEFDNDSPTISNNQLRFTFNHNPQSTYGQRMWPKTSLVKPKEIRWTPRHIHVPVVFSDNNKNQEEIETENHVLSDRPNEINAPEKIVQTLFQTGELSQSLTNTKELCVQSSSVPLVRRFVYYEQPPIINFNKDNKTEDKQQYDRVFASIPIRKQSKMPLFTSSAIKTDIFKPKNNLSCSYLKPKNAATKQLIKESVFNVKIPSKTPEISKDFEFPSRITDMTKTSVYNFEIPSKMSEKSQNNFELPSSTPDKTEMSSPYFEVSPKTPEVLQKSNPIFKVTSKTPEKTHNIFELPSRVVDMTKRSISNLKVQSKIPEKTQKSSYIFEKSKNNFELPSRPPDHTKKSIFNFVVQSKTPEKTQNSFDLPSKTIEEPKSSDLNFGVPSKTLEKSQKSRFYFAESIKTSDKTQNCFESPSRSSEMTQKYYEKINFGVPSKLPEKFKESSFHFEAALKTKKKADNDLEMHSISHGKTPPVKIRKPNFNYTPSKAPKEICENNYQVLSNTFSQANNCEVSLDSDEKLNNFDNDLRMLLLAKKRNALEAFPQSNGVDTKKPRSHVDQKKKVTFNLDNRYQIIPSIEHCEDENMSFSDKYLRMIQYLKDLAHPGVNKDWCLVPDLEVLMEEFDFLGGFVQIDCQCRLVIPAAVYSEVLLLSRGDSRGRANATCARRVVRCVHAPYVIVQPKAAKDNASSMNDAILQCCMELTGRNIHAILISNNRELVASAKCYSIHCYSINDIKNDLSPNGISPKPKPVAFKPLTITIQNNHENTTNDLDLDVDLNEREKDIIRNFKINVANYSKISSANDMSHVTPANSSVNRTVRNTYSNIFFENLMESSLPIANSNLALNTIDKTNQTNTNIISLDVDDPHNNISNEESIPTAMTANEAFGTPKNTNEMENVPFRTSKEYNDDSAKLGANTTSYIEWRGAASDITVSSIDLNIAKLNITEQTVSQNKTPKKSTQNTNNPKTNETVSFFFQKPSPRYDFSKLTINKKGRQSVSETFGQKNFDEKTPYLIEKHQNNPRKEPQTKMVTEKSLFCSESDTLKRPQTSSLNQSLFSMDNSEKHNETDNNSNMNSNYLCNKEIENQLKNRMEEWMCSFIQVMEEFLTETLKSLPPSALNGTVAPWSLYEGLQCVTYVYEDHPTVTAIIQQLYGHLYETDYGNDKLNKTIEPNDFLKALDCGTQLVKYFKTKNVGTLAESRRAAEGLRIQRSEPAVASQHTDSNIQDSDYLLDAETSLNTILNEIKHPENKYELIDLLSLRSSSKASQIINSDIVVRQDFVKDNFDAVVSYLKKHFDNYEEKHSKPCSRVRELNSKSRQENELKHKAIDRRNKKLESEAYNNLLNSITNKRRIGNMTTVHKEVSESASNDLEQSQLDQSKLIQVQNDLNKNNNIHNQTPKLLKSSFVENIKKTIGEKYNSRRDNKYKQKLKTISENMKVTKETDKTINTEGDNNKFEKYTDMKEVKITIPNNNNKQNDDRSKIDSNNQKVDAEKHDRIKPAKESQHNGIVVTCEVKEGPKIIRNMNLIKEFENKIKYRQYLDPEELNHSRILETNFDDDETHSSDNQSRITNSHNGSKVIAQNDPRINSHNGSKVIAQNDPRINSHNGSKVIAQNDPRINSHNGPKVIAQNDPRINSHNGPKVIAQNDPRISSHNGTKVIAQNDPRIIDSSFHKKTANDRNKPNDDINNNSKHTESKNDMSNKRQYKDKAMVCNESAEIYKNIKTFTSQLERYSESLSRLIDSSIQDMREGRLDKDTKKSIRLKSFEINHTLSKIVAKLVPWILKENLRAENQSSSSYNKNVLRNMETVLPCLKEIKKFHRVMNTVLSTSEGSVAWVNSRMSWNVPS